MIPPRPRVSGRAVRKRITKMREAGLLSANRRAQRRPLGGAEVSDALFDNVSALAGQMRELARQAHTGYAAEVDAVIAARSRDARRIERVLDGILDFGFDAAMVQLFKRLCRYYYTLDTVATASYVHTYRDMWDSERKEGGDG
jgi:hypothetical protein